MGAVNGDVPTYLVNYTNGGKRLCKSFEGHFAFSEACDFYERAKAEPAISSVDLCRLDGALWKWVRKPQSRGDAGEWLPDPGY
jgi:hypothetical protein